MAEGPPKCQCGYFAVGECVECGSPVCSEHGCRHNGRLLCDKDRKRAIRVERASARQEARDAEERAQAERRQEEIRAGLEEAGFPPSEVDGWSRLGIEVLEAQAFADAGVDLPSARALLQSGGTASDVLLLLEELEWSAPAALEWVEAGFPTAEAVLPWRSAGAVPQTATAWASHFPDVSLAAAWIAGGWSADDARAWSLRLDANAAAEWRDAGFAPDEVAQWPLRPELAAKWKKAGFTASEADQWEAVFDDPEEARRWHDLGVEPGTWGTELYYRVTIDEAERWLSVYPLETFEEMVGAGWLLPGAVEGMTVPDVIRWVEAGVEADEARAWRVDGFAPDEALPWREAGIGPPDAARWRTHGYDAEDADDWGAPGSDPVEARRWQEAGFDGWEARGWWRLGVPIEQAQDWTRRHLTLGDAERVIARGEELW